MQYSAAFCTPQVISKGSTCKIKIHLCMKFLLNPSFAMEMFDGSSFPIKFNVCDIHSGHHFTNPDGKVCDNILERRHTSHWLRKVVLSGVALMERVVSFGTSQQEMGHKGKILLAQYIMWQEMDRPEITGTLAVQTLAVITAQLWHLSKLQQRGVYN